MACHTLLKGQLQRKYRNTLINYVQGFIIRIEKLPEYLILVIHRITLVRYYQNLAFDRKMFYNHLHQTLCQQIFEKLVTSRSLFILKIYSIADKNGHAINWKITTFQYWIVIINTVRRKVVFPTISTLIQIYPIKYPSLTCSIPVTVYILHSRHTTNCSSSNCIYLLTCTWCPQNF